MPYYSENHPIQAAISAAGAGEMTHKEHEAMSFFKELQDRKVFRVASVYTVAMWIVIQVTADLFPAFGIPDWAMRLVYIIAIVGFPVAVILGWAFELTPEGLQRDHGGHSPGRRRRGVDFVIVGAIGLLVLFVLIKPEISALLNSGVSESEPVQHAQAVEPKPLITHPQSIAVLAFENMSSNPDTEYFSDGISEEVLNVLANIPGLQVASRTSAFAFKARADAGIRQIARELEVSYVLEGSVRRADNQVRITAQLIDARSDKHVWSETYDRELKQIFAIQDEIAGAIVERLKPVVLAARGAAGPSATRAVTDDMSVYERYLRGRSVYDQDNPSALQESIEMLKGVVEADPGFARAHSALARAYAAMAKHAGDNEMNRLAARQARAALKLDPHMREAHEVLQAIEG